MPLIFAPFRTDPNAAYLRRLLDDSDARMPVAFRSVGAGARGLSPRATLVPRLPWAIYLSGLWPFRKRLSSAIQD